MGPKRVMWVRRYQGQCRALRPLGHQGYRLRNHKKDQPLCSGYTCKPGDIRNRGLYSTLPIPHCANSVIYVDYTEMPKFGGYDFALVVTCGLTRFTRVFPCTKHITGEETIKILLEEWFCVYGAPKEINSDEDVRGS